MKFDPSIEITEDDRVYPPSEDSVLLIEAFDVVTGEALLEIGCGSGIVSLHCVKNGAVVTCGDLNEKAVALTKKNAELNALGLCVMHTNVYSDITGQYDTILFNLPYLPVDEEGELAISWSGGNDGLGPLPALLGGAPSHLNPNGRIIVVVSSLMDQDRLSDLLSEYTVRTLSELPLFFEKLRVLEIRLNR
jgi:HemK-related putative methylase